MAEPISQVAERGPSRRSALSRCIAVAPEVFARDHWGTTPLLTPADALPAGGFADLFSAEAVDELVGYRGVRTPFIRLAHEGNVLAPSRYTAPGGLGAEVGDQISSDKVLAEFAEGATIVLQGLHRLWPPLIDFTRRLVDELGHPAQVNAYVTPPSSQGFDPHYDTHDVFVLQVSGEKHWTIHAPVFRDPLPHQPWADRLDEVATAALRPPVIDRVLRPGDALYLPRGWIHSAKALGATSVHLTVGMSAYTRADVVDALISLAGEAETLRAPLPLGVDVGDPDQLRSLIEQVITELVGTLASADRKAERVSRLLGARIERDTRPEPVAPVATIAAIAGLTGESRVRWRGSQRARVDLVGDRVRITARGKAIWIPAEAVDAVRRLAQGAPVTVASLPGLDRASAVTVARRLLREGVVVTEE